MDKFPDPDKYVKYTENDFICDPFFQDWVINPGNEKDRFWDSYFQKHPDKQKAAEFAIAFLKSIGFREDFTEQSKVQAFLQDHLQTIAAIEASKVIPLNNWNRFKQIGKVAAFVGGLILAGLAVFYAANYNRKDTSNLTVKTEYGKKRSILLPDSTRIILNANSNLSFASSWKPGERREVWLEGEAFFDVKHLNKGTQHLKASEQFLVHTKNLVVVVLGTSFNIRERRDKTEVVLQRGAIKISFNDKNYRDVLMKPGDLISFNARAKKLDQTTTNPEAYTGWKENKLVLHDPAVNEIIQYLEDNFGRKIFLENADLGTRKIEGPIMITNLDDALFILTSVLNAEIIEKDSVLLLRPR